MRLRCDCFIANLLGSVPVKSLEDGSIFGEVRQKLSGVLIFFDSQTHSVAVRILISD